MPSDLALVGQIRYLQRLQEQLRQEQAESPESRPFTDLGSLSLPDLVTHLRPALEPPTQLGPLIDELEACIAPHEGQRFFWFSVPPRHWKTFTLRNAAVKHLLRWPDEGVAYATHTQSFANKQSREIRKLAVSAGIALSPFANRQDEWELAGSDGGLVARGAHGELTGRGFRLIIVDDPVKGREEANSQVERDRLWDWLEDDVQPRLTPDGCLFLVHKRWHPDDPVGRAKKSPKWRGVNLKALGGPQEDRPLLPRHWSFPVLDGIRKANAYKFASLYQGEPRPKGDTVFREPTKFDWETERPRSGYRVGYGIDLAYSEKTQARSDWSVCVRLLRVAGKLDEKPRYFVTQVHRAQVDAPSFTLTLRSAQAEEPGPMRWYASGTEKGAGDFIRQKVPALRIRPATSDKFIRAQRVAEAWNEGRILVPGGEDRPAWVDDLLDEVTSFTGVKDAHDDQVDALAAAFDELDAGGSGGDDFTIAWPSRR